MIRTWIIGTVGLVLVGCNPSDSEPGVNTVSCAVVANTQIVIEPPDWTVSTRIGQVQQLSVSDPGDCDPVVTWQSSDPNIASVTESGLVRAMRRGHATITVSDTSGLTDSVDLTIETGVPSDQPVNMYTVWPARRVQSTVMQIGDRLHTVRSPVLDDWCCTYPSPWNQGGITKYQWYNDRVGILSDVINGAGTFRVVERAREWTVLAKNNAKDFQLFRRKIILLDDQGYLKIKLTSIDGPWIQVAGPGIKQFRAHMDWPNEVLTVVRDDGLMFTKVLESDSVSAPWIQRDTVVPVERFKVFDRYIAVLREDGAFGVFDLLGQSWHLLESSGVRDFAVSNTGIFVLLDNGLLQARNSISNAWIPLATGVESFRAKGQLIAAQHVDGRFRVKETLNGQWRVFSTEHVLSYALQEGYIGFVAADRYLRVVNGINGTVVVSRDPNDPARDLLPDGDIGHITLIADVREPPTRTISTSYPNGSRKAAPVSYGLSSYLRSYPDDQTQCMLDNTVPASYDGKTHTCFWVSASPTSWNCLGSPVTCYGRFCGGGVPNDDDWDWANNVGTIDSFDQICRHHDYAGIYYKGVSDGGFDACIVRYGIDYGRLTYNGEHIVDGDPRWNGIWATMWNMSDAINNYKGWTSGCYDSYLSKFIDDTASPRTQDPPD
jgi:hypothetical protein